MRIGIDCRSLQEPEPSGVSAYTRETLRALFALPAAREHEFVCFANAFGLRFRLGRSQAAQQSLRGFADTANMPHVQWRIHRWPNKAVTAAEIITQRPRLSWMFGNVDVAFLPNLQFFPYRDTRIPFVITVHDLSFERYPDCLDTKGRLRHTLLHPAATAAAARGIISVSQYTKWDVQTLYGIAPEKIHVVYPGADAGMDAGADTGVDTAHAQPPVRGDYIAFVSTIEPRKNLETLLQAMEVVRLQHPQLQLVVVGRQGWKSSRVIQRMQRLPWVHYMGYVPEHGKHQVIARARAFVYPSLYEGFGFPPLEAQQAGVPVIAGAHSSLPEVIGNSALLVDVLDSNALARAITHVCTDNALRNTLVTAGHANAGRFTWQRSAQQVLDVLTGV